MTGQPSPEQDRTMAQRCVATCGFPECTGKGSQVHWAHPCAFAPDRPAPSCVICGVPGSLLPCGVRCPAHRPSVPDPSASLPDPSPKRAPRVYGDATTDPLGRDAWPVSKQTRLPIRPGDPRE